MGSEIDFPRGQSFGRSPFIPGTLGGFGDTTNGGIPSTPDASRICLRRTSSLIIFILSSSDIFWIAFGTATGGAGGGLGELGFRLTFLKSPIFGDIAGGGGGGGGLIPSFFLPTASFFLGALLRSSGGLSQG